MDNRYLFFLIFPASHCMFQAKCCPSWVLLKTHKKQQEKDHKISRSPGYMSNLKADSEQHSSKETERGKNGRKLAET